MSLDIPGHRLHNQFLSQTTLTEPAQVVEAMGAVQSQDYAGAKWALAQRLRNSPTDPTIVKAFNEGRILRTHVMRPTWHFVTPSDIRWILALSAARVHAVNAFMYRQQELDRTVIRKSYNVLEKALEGSDFLTRTELGDALGRAGIKNAESIRLAYIMMSAELDGLICSGPRRGKQFTYALLEERVPKTGPFTPEEALAELTRRYFATRGPATLHDFTWWSGLTMAAARQGLESVRSQFWSEEIDGKIHWFDHSISPIKEKSPAVKLLPNYDEYFVGFRDRSAIGKVAKRAGIKSDDPSFLAHVIILDGQLVGGWRRTLTQNAVRIEFQLVTTLTRIQQRALEKAADEYGAFLQRPVELRQPMK